MTLNANGSIGVMTKCLDVTAPARRTAPRSSSHLQTARARSPGAYNGGLQNTNSASAWTTRAAPPRTPPSCRSTPERAPNPQKWPCRWPRSRRSTTANGHQAVLTTPAPPRPLYSTTCRSPRRPERSPHPGSQPYSSSAPASRHRLVRLTASTRRTTPGSLAEAAVLRQRTGPGADRPAVAGEQADCGRCGDDRDTPSKPSPCRSRPSTVTDPGNHPISYAYT